MPDSVIEEATRRRDAALAEARRWEDFVKMYDTLAGGTTRQHSQVTQLLQMPGMTTQANVYKSQKSSGALAKTEEATASILRELGHPVKTAELLTKLVARGVEVGGQSPVATLSARLSRATSLINDRSKGWWFRNSTDGRSGAPMVPPVE